MHYFCENVGVNNPGHKRLAKGKREGHIGSGFEEWGSGRFRCWARSRGPLGPSGKQNDDHYYGGAKAYKSPKAATNSKVEQLQPKKGRLW